MQPRLSLVRAALQPRFSRRADDPIQVRVADALPDPCWLYDVQAAHFVGINAAFVQCWGDGAISVGCWLDRVHADDRPAVQAALQRLARGERYAIEYRATDPDGTPRWIGEDVRPVGTPAGEPRQMLGVSRDVTAGKGRELALQDELRRKDAFLAVLMHELRTPLQTLRTAGAILAASQAAPARIIERQVQHMARLVDDLGEATRITHHREHLQFEDVDLVAAVREAIDALQAGFDARQVALRLRAPGCAVGVRGDPARLAQVFNNLLHNAVKFSPAGGHVDVCIAQDAAAEEVTVSIRDEGVGIDPDALESVFDLFVQEADAPTRLRSGLGIGLSVVRRLVELHGGRVSAHSRGRGCGSRFDVTLPLRTPAPAR